MAISPDIQYKQAIDRIRKEGVYSADRTGTGTLKVHGVFMSFRPAEHFPVLTTKDMSVKKPQVFGQDVRYINAPFGEILWIMRDASNDVNLLESKYGIRKIWKPWKGEDGTIGKAYGYQVAKHDQLRRLIKGLKENPQSRRHVIDLWSETDMADMALPPCAFRTEWDVSNGELNMTLFQRSGDMGLGVPFNMAQYGFLMMLVAREVGLKVGKFDYYITNAHIYLDHLNVVDKQLQNAPSMWTPQLIIPSHLDLWEIMPEDCWLEGYHPTGGKYEMRMSV